MKLNKLALVTGLFASALSLNVMAVDVNSGTVTFEGKIYDTPCNLVNNNVKANFDQLSKDSLNAGTVAETPFEIKFSGCKLSSFKVNGANITAVKMKFTSTNVMDANKEFLDAGIGVGVGIKGYKFDESKNITNNLNFNSDVNTLNFTALAKKFSASDVTTGDFTATSAFEISYE